MKNMVNVFNGILEENMRVYKDEKIIEMYCNKCGKKINLKNGIVMEGVLSVDKKWQYFSNKDGWKHSFDICEKCYEEMIKQFHIEVTAEEYNELI